MKDKIILIASMFGLALLFGIAAVTGLAWLFKWAWNYVLPVLFHFPRIDYLQAVGLLTLTAIMGLIAKGSTLRVTQRTSY